jgi:hypothetical protein
MTLEDKRKNRQAIYRIDEKIEEILTKRFTARLLTGTFTILIIAAVACFTHIMGVCQ